MDPGLQAFSIEFTKKIVPEVEGIVELYTMDPEKGMSSYLDFIERIKPALMKIINGLSDPISIGHISPRLRRDPHSTDIIAENRSSEEKEAHVVGYIQAILHLVYCVAKGIEGWQFSGTILHKESLKTQNIGKIDIIPPLVQIVKQEIVDTPIPIIIKNDKMDKENEAMQKEPPPFEQNIDYVDDPGKIEEITSLLLNRGYDARVNVPFTARLLAYYRAQEAKRKRPLIIDPFAERLAGDMSAYAEDHKHVCGSGDYAIVRSHYIENNLLTSWCNAHAQSQIVFLGAGLDTRAYRFKSLKNTHTLYELDYFAVNNYKEEILQDVIPLCELVRISTDLSTNEWVNNLIEKGFSGDMPTFWCLEGLAYYLEREIVVNLLEQTATISAKHSQIFMDLCVPTLAELKFGPFTRYFKWGLDIQAVPAFFEKSGWNISCSYADEHDQGRDVGQRGLIFVHGVKNVD